MGEEVPSNHDLTAAIRTVGILFTLPAASLTTSIVACKARGIHGVPDGIYMFPTVPP